MAELDEEVQDELTVLLEVWENEQENASFDPEPTLNKICEIFESANNEYLMNNPDPMDDNHPIKVMPHCNFGHLLQIIFHNENFLNKLAISYLMCKDNPNRNLLAARLLLGIIPGIPSEILSDDDSTITKQLFKWAENSTSRELRAYSFGLLAVAMDTEKVIDHKVNNQTLIPIALHRLRTLYNEMTKEYAKQDEHRRKEATGPTNFASAFKADKAKSQTSNVIVSKAVEKEKMKSVIENMNTEKVRLRLSNGFHDQNPWDSNDFDSSSCKIADTMDGSASRKRRRSDVWAGNKEGKRPKLSNNFAELDEFSFENFNGTIKQPNLASCPIKEIFSSSANKETFSNRPEYLAELNTIDRPIGSFSNSSWKSTMHPIVVGSTYRLFPLSIEMEQRLILQYLTTICEYQDSLSLVLENRGMDVIQNYLAVGGCRDVRLLFDALRYTSSLLNHRKFAWEFIAAHGVEKLLQVNRFSMASTAVATCLTYLAYNADIMEKVCQLSDAVLNQMVDYALWLLDHSHEHGRELAAHFFASSLQFRTILDRFDQHDGLRRLYNYIAALAILHKTNEEIESDPSSDDLWAQSSMTIRSAVSAFRTYLSSHIYLKIEHMKRSQSTRNNSASCAMPTAIPIGGHSHTKAMTLGYEAERECVNYLLQSQCLLLPHHHNWRPIDEMRNLGVFRLMQVLLSKRRKTESVKLVLEVLHLATVSPKIQLDMCETMVIKNAPTQGVGSILEFAEGLWQDDLPPLIQKLAIEVLINCACGATDRNGGRGIFYKITSIKPNLLPPSVIAQLATNSKPTTSSNTDNLDRVFLEPLDILQIIWNCAQQNNVIMVLTTLLHTKEPPTDADMLREVACRALNGIVRHDPVRQILSKLPLIAANELNALMQEPILLEKRQEHSKFCEQARLLIESITETKIMQDYPKDMTQEKLWKSAVVAQTRIVYNEKELLQLMYQHLIDIGFKKTAGQLQLEANLPNIPASRIPRTPASLPGFPRKNDQLFVKTKGFLANSSRNSLSSKFSLLSTPVRRSLMLGNEFSIPSTTATPRPNFSAKNMSSLTPLQHSPKRIAQRLNSSCSASLPSTSAATQPMTTPSNATSQFSLQVKPHKALGEIVTEYFRKQHAVCRNPVATCPPFSLFYPHKCPEPKLMYSAPSNLAKRVISRSVPPYRCSAEMLRQADRRMVFSRFRYLKTFEEEDEIFTCCNFSNDDEYIQMGNFTGDIFVFNIKTGQHVSTTNCHHSFLTSIEQSKDGSLMLTSSGLLKPLSMLWRMGQMQEPKEQLIEFPEETFVDFGHNRSAHLLVGTLRSRATIYDTETGLAIVQLYDETLANGYERNRACFDPMDELVLNDGILFDPRIGSSGRVVHKFDKLNPDISGCFHPKGSEVIINSEVWDLRTYRLLHTVPALNQCKIMFNSTANIIFGTVYLPQDSLDDYDPHLHSVYNSSFRTIDAGNYQVITTMDTKRQLHDFCCDHSDNYVAMIEANPTFHDPSLCKIFEIGRGREVDEEEEEDDLDDEDDEGDGPDDPTLLDFGNSSGEDSESSSSSSSEDHYSSSEEGDEEEENVASLNLEVEEEADESANDEEEDEEGEDEGEDEAEETENEEEEEENEESLDV